MTGIDRCIDFCRLLDPAFPAGLRGSTAADIDAFERASRRPLREIHRAFLEKMGESTGSLNLGAYSTSPARLLAERAATLPGLGPDAELFAVPTGDNEDEILLLPSGVVRRDEDGEDEVVAGSLEELICLPMLNARYTARQPLQQAFVARELGSDGLATCRRIGALFGFETYWFSTAIAYVARRKTLVLVARQAPERYLSVSIAGREEFELGVIARVLERELELEPYR